ncbi:Flp family type IVb pilin [Aminobacterium sp. MB27-C1]|uniref:Flp family type IVb pilin n=1 Tax=Aminobacterium sp. MB27-C1 TaxID=3070661 RepID=UPI0027DB37AA|nr:Flp family type IVb pilin [Aminobacterium sp. MB27-C1]WMI72322.1 Flp family type IVb pilin [Aminobacterium sp. MB27-C1]
MIEKLRNLVWDEEGQGMVEYGLIIALISIAAIVAITAIGPKINTAFTKANNALPAE